MILKSTVYRYQEFNSNDIITINLKIFKAIYDAIETNPNAETQLQMETKLYLERKVLQWRIYPLNEIHFISELGPSYKKWQTRLEKYKDAEDKAAFEQITV